MVEQHEGNSEDGHAALQTSVPQGHDVGPGEDSFANADPSSLSFAVRRKQCGNLGRRILQALLAILVELLCDRPGRQEVDERDSQQDQNDKRDAELERKGDPPVHPSFPGRSGSRRRVR